jgi:UDP-N-acetylenolpyruvoylglucosamine reductase
MNAGARARACACVCVCVCVSEREGRRETKYRRKGTFIHRKNFIVCSVHVIRLE